MHDLAHFAELVSQHDLTYQMSDDPRVWRAGDASWRQIVAVKDELGAPYAAACRAIWNAKVQREMRPDAWARWSWKD